MISVAKLDDVIKNMGKRTGYELIGEKDGCVNGCRCGVSVYTREDYDLTHAGAHDDQEGFFVLEGRGRAMVGDDVRAGSELRGSGRSEALHEV